MNRIATTIGLVTVCAIASILITGCPSGNTTPVDTFDRQAMLAQVADGTIIPSYNRLAEATVQLAQTANTFTQAPSIQTLDACTSAWNKVADAWQDARAFDFGPAEGLFGNLAENVGTYPISSSKIEGFIASGDTSLAGFDRDAWGIYGAEYLLFGAPPPSVVEAFADPTRAAYLRMVISKVMGEVVAVQQAWQTGYRAEFVSRNGTDPGSGTSLLFNNMVRSYEQLKNYALGLPLGKIAGQVRTEPEKVEGFYSGRSVILAKLHYAAVMRIWQGASLDAAPILGFRQYLSTIPNGDMLMISTLEQDVEITRAFQQLENTERLSSLIETNPGTVEAVYGECQKMTRYLKSDLSSLLGIAITFSSGDGD